jgi:hypothetical protein
MKPQEQLPDDEEDFPAEELEDAINETSAKSGAPEVDQQTAALTEWDEPPTSSGHEVPTSGLDDEATVAEQLVSEGINEAERERRIAASDPDFEP